MVDRHADQGSRGTPRVDIGAERALLHSLTDVTRDAIVNLDRIALKEQVREFVTLEGTEEQQPQIRWIALNPLQQQPGDCAKKLAIALWIFDGLPVIVTLALPRFAFDYGAIQIAFRFEMLVYDRFGHIQRSRQLTPSWRHENRFSEKYKRTAAAMIASRRSLLFIRVLIVVFITFTPTDLY